MLRKLIIRNFAIIDELSIDFSGELNLITGETGAGKSIIVGALSLLLGDRVDSKTVFKQGAKCIIEGVFEIADLGLKPIFEEYELDYLPESLLRREISLEGKSRAFINDTPVSLATLAIFGNRLIDIHSQHETLEINQESFQVRVLDSVAGQIPVMEEFKNMLVEYKKRERTRIQLEESRGKNRTEFDFLEFQIEELEKAKILDPLEQEKLESELLELTHSEDIQKGLNQFMSLIDGEEESVLSRLKQAQNALIGMEKFYPTVSPIVERIKTCQIEIRDIVQEVGFLTEKIIFNPSKMVEVQGRLNLLYTLEQKHKVGNLEGLILFFTQLKNSRDGMSQDENHLQEVERENTLLREHLTRLGIKLNEGRHKVTPKIEKEIKKNLTELGIKEGDFQIHIENQSQNFTQFGFDRIRFLFSANKGFPPAELSKVASGGELSRLVLAIKALSAEYISMPTVLLDEIDTGVSGEVAMKVGRVMKKLSLKNQVIAITHLPQIASREGSHFLVYKETSSGISKTFMKQLSPENRIGEIAKMLSGNNPGEFALKNARELMESL